MESDLGKLFIGGISWDTDEDRLREYFQGFGEVVEAVIMRDRASGRARGFGFIVFSDPAVAERVVLEKHLIDGRMVEAKKAVPRDDHSILNRNSNTILGSPGPTRTKKIFVGGLPSTITDTEFRDYFEQFGAVTDVVVMYDHNTQRPRGFGFITYESEDSVDKALLKTFHELSGKLVEVKRAVPKELSPSPNIRSPITGYNYGITRLNSFLNGYAQGFNPSPIGGYGFRTDPRFGQLGSGRSGFPSLSPGYGMGMNFEPGMNTSFGNSLNLNSNVSYGRTLSPYYSENSNRFSSPIGYGGGNISPGSIFSSPARNLWGNNSGNLGGNNTNPARSISYLNSGNNNNIGDFGGSGINWERSSSPISSNNVGNFGLGASNFGLGGGSNFGRSSGQVVSGNSSFNALNNGYERDYSDSFGNRTIYDDPTWRSASLDLDSSGPFRYGLEDEESDVIEKSSTGFVGGSFNVTSRQANGVSGIAA